MPGFSLAPTSVYNPMVKRPPASSRRQSPSTPEAQTPVAAVPMVGGGMTNVQQPQQPAGGMSMVPGMVGTAGPRLGLGGAYQAGVGVNPIRPGESIVAPGSNVPQTMNSPSGYTGGMGGQLAPSVMPPPNPELNDQRVQGHTPVSAADYQRAGVPIPLSSRDRVIGGGGVPGRFGNIGVNQASGITTTEGGYVSPQIVHGQGADQRYTPPLSQQDQATVNRQRQYSASSFGDRGLTPESYKRFEQGGQFAAGQAPQGPQAGSGEIGAPKTYHNGRRTNVAKVETGGPKSGPLSEDMNRRRLDHIAQQDAKREGLAAGRKQRAMDRNGLESLRPQQSGSSGTGGIGNTGYNVPGTANASPPVPNQTQNARPDMGVLEANFNKTIERPIFKSNPDFKVADANMGDAIKFYQKHNPKWSENDKNDFKTYLEQRAGKDPEGEFKKDLDSILGDGYQTFLAKHKLNVTEMSSLINDIRKMYGKSPIQPKEPSKSPKWVIPSLGAFSP